MKKSLTAQKKLTHARQRGGEFRPLWRRSAFPRRAGGGSLTVIQTNFEALNSGYLSVPCVGDFQLAVQDKAFASKRRKFTFLKSSG
jgi:hypothetical protein